MATTTTAAVAAAAVILLYMRRQKLSNIMTFLCRLYSLPSALYEYSSRGRMHAMDMTDRQVLINFSPCVANFTGFAQFVWLPFVAAITGCRARFSLFLAIICTFSVRRDVGLNLLVYSGSDRTKS